MESCFLCVCKIFCADYSFTLAHVGDLAVKLLMFPVYSYDDKLLSSLGKCVLGLAVHLPSYRLSVGRGKQLGYLRANILRKKLHKEPSNTSFI